MTCQAVFERRDLQVALEQANSDWTAQARQYRADVDAALLDNTEADFNVPGCTVCDSIVKPDVVMFGEHVLQDRIDEATKAVERADSLLVVGSITHGVFGFSLRKPGRGLGKPLAIVNRGRMRADDITDLKVDEDCLTVLPAAVDALMV